MRAVLDLPDDEVVRWNEVEFCLSEFDRPGHPKRIVNCGVCREKIFDGKDLAGPGGPVCISCLRGGYYTVKAAAVP
ncbi:MAG: hypothetical protein JW795_03230 [Chitinivibrionales bacterium]|nr:hypothetical protein [Chitinivibrionales bacterium]